MLTYVDRMQVAVQDRRAAEEAFSALLGARKVREDGVKLLAAARTVVQAGASEFELLQPEGEGAVQEHLARWGEGIFAAGFSTANLSAVSERLSAQGIEWREDGGQVYLEPDQTVGFRMVLTPERERSQEGPLRWLYEITNIVDDHEAAAAFYAGAFGLDTGRFCPIESEQYGYVGRLLLFDPPARLDRIELTQVVDPSSAMGRFAAKRGQSIYMGYVETDDVGAIVERLQARDARWAPSTPDPEPEGLFIHPASLHGVLLGVSRTNLAWTWSGRPELARKDA